MTTSVKDIPSSVDLAPELDDGKMCLAKAKVSLTGISDIWLTGLSADMSNLDLGKKIKIEPITISKTTTEQAPEKSNDYTITKGDNLTKIAKANDTTVSELAKLNKIDNPNKIYIGQKIKLHADTPKTEAAVIPPKVEITTAVPPKVEKAATATPPVIEKTQSATTLDAKAATTGSPGISVESTINPAAGPISAPQNTVVDSSGASILDWSGKPIRSGSSTETSPAAASSQWI